MGKAKIKEVKLPMKFNPGLQKYEPQLPFMKKSKKNVKVTTKGFWKELIIILVIIISLIIFLYKYGLN